MLHLEALSSVPLFTSYIQSFFFFLMIVLFTKSRKTLSERIALALSRALARVLFWSYSTVLSVYQG